MSEEMKLLRALIDALGFEVKEVNKTIERKMSLNEFRYMINNLDKFTSNDGWMIKHNNGRYCIDEFGMYTKAKNVRNFKVIPKEPGSDKD